MDNIDWGHLLFQFDGRINRAKFWLAGISIYVAFWILMSVAVATDSSALRSMVGLLSILSIWPYLAVAIKRWHDRDKSGWWVLITLIPIIGFIWALVETGFLVGTAGPNQYGPDPLAAPGALEG
jgi:uncharacterized membrane protein YhaH (DUF805 family)